MNNQEILDILKGFKYPNLDKNIIDLALLDKLDIKDNVLNIYLKLTNVQVFELLSVEIKKSPKLQSAFKEIHVFNTISSPKKSINYGSTATPNNRAPYAKNIIAISSGKGGVGKSTVAANLAVSLAQEGFSVGILDADVYGPNIPRLFGVENESLRWNENDKIIPSFNYGVKIMSVGLTTPRADTPLVWRSSVAVSALIQFLEDVDWGELDYLVIDMPPGTGDVQLTMAQELHLNCAILVTTPQASSIDDVSRAIVMFQEVGVKVCGLIENMSYFIAPDTNKRYDIFGTNMGENLSLKYNIEFLGQIPLSIDIREHCDMGKPPVTLKNSAIKEYYKSIVAKIVNSQ